MRDTKTLALIVLSGLAAYLLLESHRGPKAQAEQYPGLQKLMTDEIRAQPVKEFKHYHIDIEYFGRMGPDGNPETRAEMAIRSRHE